jgi:hypothetical protein
VSGQKPVTHGVNVRLVPEAGGVPWILSITPPEGAQALAYAVVVFAMSDGRLAAEVSYYPEAGADLARCGATARRGIDYHRQLVEAPRV